MITNERDEQPQDFAFDVVVVAVGFERRCRWVTEQTRLEAKVKIGLEFGFLQEASYDENRAFFETRGFSIVRGLGDLAVDELMGHLAGNVPSDRPVSILVDISSMSREMIANITLAINSGLRGKTLDISIAYAPSKFSGAYEPAPIRIASPITPSLAGWSANPERPVGAIFGLGCEPGLALGAMQFLEPNKAWVFSPIGVDSRFDQALAKANEHIEDIFDVTRFDYAIESPTATRGRFESLLNTLDNYYRLIVVPFGPKIFCWIAISTVTFCDRKSIGVWAFSSKEQAKMVDRAADGPIIWHKMRVNC